MSMRNLCLELFWLNQTVRYSEEDSKYEREVRGKGVENPFKPRCERASESR